MKDDYTLSWYVAKELRVFRPEDFWVPPGRYKVFRPPEPSCCLDPAAAARFRKCNPPCLASPPSLTLILLNVVFFQFCIFAIQMFIFLYLLLLVSGSAVPTLSGFTNYPWFHPHKSNQVQVTSNKSNRVQVTSHKRNRKKVSQSKPIFDKLQFFCPAMSLSTTHLHTF